MSSWPSSSAPYLWLNLHPNWTPLLMAAELPQSCTRQSTVFPTSTRLIPTASNQKRSKDISRSRTSTSTTPPDRMLRLSRIFRYRSQLERQPLLLVHLGPGNRPSLLSSRDSMTPDLAWLSSTVLI